MLRTKLADQYYPLYFSKLGAGGLLGHVSQESVLLILAGVGTVAFFHFGH